MAEVRVNEYDPTVAIPSTTSYSGEVTAAIHPLDTSVPKGPGGIASIMFKKPGSHLPPKVYDSNTQRDYASEISLHGIVEGMVSYWQASANEGLVKLNKKILEHEKADSPDVADLKKMQKQIQSNKVWAYCHKKIGVWADKADYLSGSFRTCRIQDTVEVRPFKSKEDVDKLNEKVKAMKARSFDGQEHTVKHKWVIVG